MTCGVQKDCLLGAANVCHSLYDFARVRHNDCLTVMALSGDGAAAMFELTQDINVMKNML